jgi:Cu-processing system permease protein
VIRSAATSPLFLCARQELRLAARSRWIQAFALLFGVLALGVAGSGYVLSGGTGMQDFARTAASLLQLVLLLVPLTALVIGVLELAPERGEVELLYSQPVRRSRILLGRLAGLFAALAAAQACGLGAAGLVLFVRSGPLGAGAYALLFAAALLVTAVFLGIAALLSAGGPGRRTRALALAVVVWFVAEVLLDVAALGAATLLPSGAASRALILAALVNPITAIRTGALLGIQGTTAFGAASLALLRFTAGPAGAAALLLFSVAAWIGLPVALAVRRLSRADL